MTAAPDPSSDAAPIRVLIADDHAIVRQGLSLMLTGQTGIEVIGEAADGAEAVSLAEQLHPHVILMDLAMPGKDGIKATEEIEDTQTGSAVVVLTTFGDADNVMAALDAGAVGYLMKDATPDQIVDAVRSAHSGGSPLDPRAARTVLEARRRPESVVASGSGAPQLTAKQTEVLGLVAEGLSNRRIARTLGISEKTVKAHLTTVYAALGVSDRVQAALWYSKRQ